MTVLRRLDCVLAPTKQKVLDVYEKMKDGPVRNLEPFLKQASGYEFYNISKFTFESLKGDPDNLAVNLVQYMKSFNDKAQEIIDSFGFEEHIAKLDKTNRLYLLVERFSELDCIRIRSLTEMGYILKSHPSVQ